jgi:hypothetical protein
MSEDSKYCRYCDKTRAIDEFRIKRSKTSAGTICTYRDNRCNKCRWAADLERYERRKAGLTLPPGRPVTVREVLWAREPEQAECDTAFMGWRMTNPGTNLPTLSWRV